MNHNNHQISPLTLTEQSKIDSAIPAHIVSKTPGRIRVRVASSHRQKHKIASLVSALKEELAIYRVKANVHSGSITLFHAQEHLNHEDIRHILQDLGLIFSDTILKTPNVNQGPSDAAAEVSRVAVKLNRDVRRATKGAVDLQFLLPFSFAILALRQLLVKGLQFEIIPWYVLAWYAFDSFIKLHGIDEPS